MFVESNLCVNGVRHIQIEKIKKKKQEQTLSVSNNVNNTNLHSKGGKTNYSNGTSAMLY